MSGFFTVLAIALPNINPLASIAIIVACLKNEYFAILFIRSVNNFESTIIGLISLKIIPFFGKSIIFNGRF